MRLSLLNCYETPILAGVGHERKPSMLWFMMFHAAVIPAACRADTVMECLSVDAVRQPSYRYIKANSILWAQHGHIARMYLSNL